MRQILNLFLFLIFSASLFAQAPEKFKFQAVARDASGAPYSSENLAVRVSLVRDGVSGLLDYSERHEVTTSPLGVFDLEIGGGVALSGMMADANWANHPYYLKIDIDPTGGTSYMNLGTSQLLSVPYAIYAGNAGNGGGGGDPTDELQNLIYDPASQTLTLTDGNAVTLTFPGGGSDDQTLSLSGTTLSIEDGNAINLSSLQDGVDDADADPTNEIQSLSFNAVTNELSISGSNAVTIPSGGTDADADPMNEIQTLNKTGSTVSLSNGGGSFTDEVDDADANASNELQTISLSGNTLTLSDGGGNVNIPGNTDSQTLTFNPVTNELSISGGNVITIPSGGTDADADPMNEIQVISLSGNSLSLSNGGGAVNLPDSDSQTLTFNPVTNELSISGGNAITIPSGGTDADADPMNEIQMISLSGNSLSLSNGGGAVNLPDSDSQTLTFNPVTNELSISGGNAITIPSGGTDADADPMNELQTISKAGSTVTLSDGGGTFNDDVNDADADPANEIQSLSFNIGTNELSISDGNVITIPSGGTDADADPMNELQDLSLSGTTLSIENGNNVDLSAVQDGVDDADADPANEMQSLSFNPVTNELSISGTNAVTIPSGGTDADADPMNELQTISKAGSTVTLSDGGGTFNDDVNDADSDPTNEIETWATLAGIPADIADGDAVNDADADPANEMQSLSFNPVTNELSISGTNAVTIPSGGTDADADPMNELQTISKTGSTVTLSNGGGTFNDDVNDADSDPTNEIETWATLAGIPADIADGDAVNDADADPANEMQSLSFNPVTNELSISGTNAVTIPTGGTDADADPMNELQTISKTGSTVTLSNGGGTFNDDVNDADSDPTNEIETWATLAGIPADIADGDAVNDADADPANEIQTLSISGDQLSLSNGGGNVNLPAANDDQILTLSGTLLSIENGNAVDVSIVQDGFTDADADPANEIQTLSKSGATVSLSNGGGSFTDEVNDADADASNEIQTLSVSGNTLSLSDGGGDVDLSSVGSSPIWTQDVTDVFYEGGDVGIGTNMPGAKLDVNDLGTTEVMVRSGSQGGTAKVSLINNLELNGFMELVYNGETTPGNHADGTPNARTAEVLTGTTTSRLAVGTKGPSPIHLMTADTTRMFVAANGKVGVGTTSPTDHFVVKSPEFTQADIQTPVLDGNAGLSLTVEDVLAPNRTMQMELNGPNYLGDFNDGTPLASTGSILTGSDVSRMVTGTTVGPLHLMTNTATRMFIAPDGKVGIGTIAPAYELTLAGGQNRLLINSDGGGSDALLKLETDDGFFSYFDMGLFDVNLVDFYTDGTTKSGATYLEAGGSTSKMILNSTGGPMHLMTGGNTRMFVANDGKIGIGTSTPEFDFHIRGELFVNSQQGKIHFGAPNNGDQWAFSTAGGGETLLLQSKADGSNLFSNRFLFEQDGNFIVNSGNVIVNSGNVGINNTSPDEELVIGSNLGNGWAFPAMTAGSASGGAVAVGTPDTKISMSAGTAFNRARIIAQTGGMQGTLDIEMKTSGLTIGENPGISDAMLEVEHGGFGLVVQHAGNTNNHWEIYASSVSSDPELRLYTDDGQRGEFDPVSGAYTAVSDRRLKRNIHTIGTVLPAIMTLEPSRYQFIHDDKGSEYLGFIAQDVQKVFPELVNQSAIEKEGDVEFTLDYSGFGIIAIKAIQEQQQTIEKQEETIETQNEKIENLEQRLERLEALLLKD